MIPPEPSPILRRLIALYQATRRLEKDADFHGEMLQHAQEIEKALTPPVVDKPAPESEMAR